MPIGSNSDVHVATELCMPVLMPVLLTRMNSTVLLPCAHQLSARLQVC